MHLGYVRYNEAQVTKIRNDKEAWVISCVGEREPYNAGWRRTAYFPVAKSIAVTAHIRAHVEKP